MGALHPVSTINRVVTSEAQTTNIGRCLGVVAEPGDIFLLSGELGAGKTCLVRGLATGLGVAEHAFSPSFVLLREYRGRLRLYHMDFYRLDTPAEIETLGIDDYLSGDGVCAIEWAERAEGLLPGENLHIHIAYVHGMPDSRTIRLTPSGSRYEHIVRQLVAMGDPSEWS